ncbi:hypothetical protein J1605_009601 [Eschrichtius robustus]|uniref:Peptidase M14 domain-containing protein n=1 Tax=Eschrichtius robustus TaxID=9764 RepID=A0AB34GUJ8_ESCRO|nr:hypothetical protein J1605_009601 [Eschrichtius robustus]
MDNLVAEHPGLVSKVDIGYSFKNRPMNVLKLSTGGDKLAIWLEAGIHDGDSLFSLGFFCIPSQPGTSNNPCSDSYRGPSANSEVEVKSIVDFIKGPGKVTAFITFNSYSQLLMFPYGYTCAESHKFDELNEVAQKAAQSLTSLHGTKYKVGPICSVIYQASGGSTDWSYDSGIKYSFEFELGDTDRYDFLLLANQILPTVKETWFGLKTVMEHVRDHPY